MVLLTSEERPYVWKVIDVSSERENYTEVIKKIETMLKNLKKKKLLFVLLLLIVH